MFQNYMGKVNNWNNLWTLFLNFNQAFKKKISVK